MNFNTTESQDILGTSAGGDPGLLLLATPDVGVAPGEYPVEGSLRIGRETGPGHLGLLDSALSRRHVLVRCHARRGLLELTDLGSKNGTFVNGRRVGQQFLRPGDVIRVGNTLLLVTRPGRDVVEAGASPELVGDSEAMHRVRRLLRVASAGKLPVLLVGETGTGKELAARAVHDLSGRTGQFQAVNCPAVPEALFESTFFGHRKGAFTDAREDSPGLIRGCENGTLFLDEVGELPLACQPKFLRFLEDHRVRAVGAPSDHEVSVAIIAATNADLHALVQDGRFRADLLARLEGFVVELPSLRSRRQDVPQLFAHFAALEGVSSVTFDPNALEALLIYPWSHNVRAMRSLVGRLLLEGAEGRERSVDGGWHVTLDELPTEFARAVVEREAAPEEVVARNPDGSPTRDALLALMEGRVPLRGVTQWKA